MEAGATYYFYIYGDNSTTAIGVRGDWSNTTALPHGSVWRWRLALL